MTMVITVDNCAYNLPIIINDNIIIAIGAGRII